MILLHVESTAIAKIRRILNNRTLCFGGPGQWKLRNILKMLTLAVMKVMFIKATVVTIPPKKVMFVTALVMGRLANATTRIKDKAIAIRKRIFLVMIHLRKLSVQYQSLFYSETVSSS